MFKKTLLALGLCLAVSASAFAAVTEKVEQGKKYKLSYPVFKLENRAAAKAINKDLKSMVVKTVVLLTASIVYAMIPKVMFWGKVSAAAAVSVAAGVVASGFVSMVEWSDEDLKNTDKDFSAWLEEITVEPFTDWALAQGVLNAQMAATNNPVTSALVLGVFALYHIGEDAKTLMKKYNWEV